MDYARTEPIREFARRRGLSPQTVYDWNTRGFIQTFLIGKRRHVVLSTYEQLVERLVAEQAGKKLASPNPRARQEVVRSGSRDTQPTGSRSPITRSARRPKRRRRRQAR